MVMDGCPRTRSLIKIPCEKWLSSMQPEPGRDTSRARTRRARSAADEREPMRDRG